MAVELLGRTDIDDLREIWPDEAKNFTPWLLANLDDLSRTLSLGDLEPLTPVPQAGHYQPDIVARDEDKDLIVIENQLGPTNHDHLGKLLTYMAWLDARVGVWVTIQATAEHKKAVEFVNSLTGDDFALYLVEIRAFTVGDNGPTTWLFQQVVFPSTQVKQLVRRGQRETTSRREANIKARMDFLTMAVAKIREKAGLFMNVNPCEPNQWVSQGLKIGKGGLVWAMVVTTDRCRAEFYICHSDPRVNVERHKLLLENKDDIEKAVGAPLAWTETTGNSRTVRHWLDGGLKDVERWPEITDKLTDAMAALAKALEPYLSRLPDRAPAGPETDRLS